VLRREHAAAGASMKLFHPDNRSASEEHARLWALYEIAYTVVDFLAALMFVVGSILFFWPSTTHNATWLFVIGSCFFGLKPSIRLVREIRLVSLGDPGAVAMRLED
jgi:RsiW-degrading membrane proteinase PrsW (M82 family)